MVWMEYLYAKLQCFLDKKETRPETADKSTGTVISTATDVYGKFRYNIHGKVSANGEKIENKGKMDGN